MWVSQEVVTNDKSSGGKAVESLHSKNSSITQEFQLKEQHQIYKDKDQTCSPGSSVCALYYSKKYIYSDPNLSLRETRGIPENTSGLGVDKSARQQLTCKQVTSQTALLWPVKKQEQCEDAPSGEVPRKRNTCCDLVAFIIRGWLQAHLIPSKSKSKSWLADMSHMACSGHPLSLSFHSNCKVSVWMKNSFTFL